MGEILKTKKAEIIEKQLIQPLIFCVVWAGIEPATQGFSVLCSTD